MTLTASNEGGGVVTILQHPKTVALVDRGAKVQELSMVSQHDGACSRWLIHHTLSLGATTQDLCDP